jgi:hypothetical protein
VRARFALLRSSPAGPRTTNACSYTIASALASCQPDCCLRLADANQEVPRRLHKDGGLLTCGPPLSANGTDLLDGQLHSLLADGGAGPGRLGPSPRISRCASSAALRVHLRLQSRLDGDCPEIVTRAGRLNHVWRPCQSRGTMKRNGAAHSSSGRDATGAAPGAVAARGTPAGAGSPRGPMNGPTQSVLRTWAGSNGAVS